MRQNIAYIASLVAVFALLSGCSSSAKVASSPLPIPPIHLHIKADPQLNLFNKIPHTVLLCVYLLRDPYTINQLQEERDGLQKLLDCGRFDSSILHARRLVLQPGQELDQAIDRPEDARFVSVVGGYFNARKDQSVRSLAIPAPGASPQKMSIALQLGPQAMQTLQLSGERK
ncbi:type VI secretion system lipoprotein TssJ [Geomonas sp. Red32]|uniref:type VI secretion system lipoprotein TssJ n=1 Tax=Geomonas sp. Red32 TaxID=2912856 RepID=UPI00202CDA35|nr:type VI secretion system lipoprotein TssJ [Geomonas sp. Red32]MCM0082088.1 type VI secretion system lipoprotein TssJ [Geomonas sp. Red32]